MQKVLSPTSTEAVDLFQTVTKVVRGPKTVYYRSIDNNHHKPFTKNNIMKNQTNYRVYLINHQVEGEAWMALTANHEIHAARKAEKSMGYGWEAIIIN